jgi:hypothetical protein
MDTLAHSLWSLAGGRAARSKTRGLWLAFWGAFPDLVWLPFTAWELMTAHQLVYFMSIYRLSHSLVIWAAVVALISIKWRRAIYWMWPWALHVIIDIPGHQSMPTPFLWPLSNFSIRGWFDWLNIYFVVGTYAALTLVWGLLWWRNKKPLVK